MVKSVLILSGSPKKDGNTAILVDWFAEGARSKGAEVEIVHIGAPRFKASGCMACRACQSSKKYECVIPDDATPLLARMPDKDVIVMASPLYFYGASAQLKAVFDRFFSLYKWDNLAGTMETPLKGKRIHSAATALKLMRDPRQEFWKGLPPQRHRVQGFEKLPGVKDVAFGERGL